MRYRHGVVQAGPGLLTDQAVVLPRVERGDAARPGSELTETRWRPRGIDFGHPVPLPGVPAPPWGGTGRLSYVAAWRVGSMRCATAACASACDRPDVRGDAGTE